MEGRIGRLQVHYRVVRSALGRGFPVSALDRIVRDRLASGCENVFNQVFEADPTVYVLRKVKARVAMLNSALTHEPAIAERWSKCLGMSVTRCIAAGEDHDNLVRFVNQAEFVARFLADFVMGTAWEQWYYGAFQRYRRLSAPEVILAILQDNRECVWDILRRLRGSNAIEAVLVLLGPHGQRKLWEESAAGGTHDESPDTFRIFVQTAYWMIDTLALWCGTRPSESATLDAYHHTKPSAPQWRSSISLAEAVADVIRFLARQGLVSGFQSLKKETKADLERMFSSRLDWLDTKHLAGLVTSIVETAPRAEEKSFVLRPIGITPAQKVFLDKIRRLIIEGQCRLDMGTSTAEANLLRLMTALSEYLEPGFVSAAVLESIIKTWMVLRRHPRPADALALLRQGTIGPIFGAARVAMPASVAHDVERVARLGDPAIAVVEALITQSGDSPDSHGVVIESRCVGLFLLIRAVQDIRLGVVVKECGSDMIQPLLMGLAIKIGGRTAWEDGILDPGAGLWTGLESETTVQSFQRLERLEFDRFEAALRDLVSAQRLIDVDGSHASDLESPSLPCAAPINAMLDRTAALTLRAWAYWLPGLRSSSLPYLVSQFIRRPGSIRVGPRHIHISLAPRPLDAILRMAGYLHETPPVSWLENRSVRFEVRA
jgi:hypothetical protein